MPVIQTIDYKKVTKSELELQREKIVADKLKILLPQIDVDINIDFNELTVLEKNITAFQNLAEQNKGIFQTAFDEQYLVYTVSVTAQQFQLKERDVDQLFPSLFSKDTLEIFPTTDEQGHTCISISKRFSF